ncbi:MAG TPA: hypothetical protein VLU46_10545 [Thermoanaerobaculia bacterium]|nr:hypothetical protein [Thermoanaerobaculia bacterium]
MKRSSIALITVAFAAAAHAGITYEFKTTTSGMAEHAMSGVVKSDAGKRRIEITASDDAMFPTGAVMLSSGSALTVIDPAKKTYYDLDLEHYIQQASNLGGGMLKLEFGDPKASVHDDGPAETIAGYPTRRETVQTVFTVAPSIPGAAQNMKVAVQATTQIWLTDKLPADAANVLQTSRLHTGVAAIDKLLDATASLKGFPLKQVTTTNVSMNGGDPMTGTTTTIVSNIVRDANVDASQFTLPAGYTKVDDPLKTQMKNMGLD